MKSVSGRDTTGAAEAGAVSEVVLDADDAPVPSAGGSEDAREHAVAMARTAIATAVVARRVLVFIAAPWGLIVRSDRGQLDWPT
jgi:hypothetical protein